jgi:hypothetical protein
MNKESEGMWKEADVAQFKLQHIWSWREINTMGYAVAGVESNRGLNRIRSKNDKTLDRDVTWQVANTSLI